MRSLEIVEIEDGLGIILPDEMLAVFKDAQDSTVFLSETVDGFALTTTDPQTSTIQTDSSS